MKKTLIIKELKSSVSVKFRHQLGSKSRTFDVARFTKTGAGYCGLGAALRYYKSDGFLDEIEFSGHSDIFSMLVSLGAIENPVAA